MSGQFQNNNSDHSAVANDISVMSKGFTQYQDPSELNKSENIEKEDHRYMFLKQHSSSTSESFIHTCFIGFMQTGDSDKVGPFILNITPEEENKSIKIIDLDLDFINEDQFITSNPSQRKTITAIQKKLERALTNPRITVTKEPRSSPQHFKDHLSSCQIRFKMTPLPFDHYFINSGNKKRVSNVDYGCQTVDEPIIKERNDEDMINILREQIMVLKDQNQLLRQQDISRRRGSSRPIKEYVIRKQSQSTMKSTRNNSAISSEMMIESGSVVSEKRKSRYEELTNLTLITNENSSLQEMLQEYMLENEALRQLNNSLEAVKASHNSELDVISQKNKELSSKVLELSKKVKDDNSNRQVANDSIISLKEHLHGKGESSATGYPITFERSEGKAKTTSYLKQYDALKTKLQNEITKPTLIPMKSSTSGPETQNFKDRPSESLPNRRPVNDSLLEELNRIDVTIKEHIKMNQFNETLRNMGKRQSPRKN